MADKNYVHWWDSDVVVADMAFYKSILRNVCRHTGIDEGPAMELVDAMDMRGFFTSPASSRFHGVSEGGLARHSLNVLRRAADLVEPFHVDSGYTEFPYWLSISCLFHDACKAGLYVQDFRNVKDSKGNWNKQPYYRVKEGATACGHGGESLRRISKYLQLPDEWALAVYWHMGARNLSDEENIQYMNACKAHREVYLLHVADMLSVVSGED